MSLPKEVGQQPRTRERIAVGTPQVPNEHGNHPGTAEIENGLLNDRRVPSVFEPENRLVEGPNRRGAPGFQREGFPWRFSPPVDRGFSGAVLIERTTSASARPQASETQESPLLSVPSGKVATPVGETEGTSSMQVSTNDGHSLGQELPFRRISMVTMKAGKVVDEKEAPAQTREAILSQYEMQRAHALSIYPDHTGGERERSIDAFFEEEGLKLAPTILLTREELPLFVAKMETVGFQSASLRSMGQGRENEGGIAGLYLNNLGLTVAVRPTKFQQAWQDVYLKYIMAHEKAHSTSQNEDSRYKDTDHGPALVSRNTGLAIWKPGGNYPGVGLEEAFGDYMGARYLRRKLNKPNGAMKTPKYHIFNGVAIPPVYVWPAGNRAVKLTLGAPLAHGLELLARQRPELHGALIQSRSSEEGRQQVAHIINGVQPGLYNELYGLGEGFADSIKGLKKIKHALAA